MKLLLFSDLHRDIDAAKSLVQRSAEADVLVGAGDFAVCRNGIEDCIEILKSAECPVVMVPGNGESFEELKRASGGWKLGHVLHGTGSKVAGRQFFGIGGGVPVTPFGSWSWDFTEQQAQQLLQDCPDRSILVSHSPPYGIADITSSGDHRGSSAVLAAINQNRPELVVCGHIHDSWETKETVGESLVVNAGPKGVWVSL